MNCIVCNSERHNRGERGHEKTLGSNLAVCLRKGNRKRKKSLVGTNLWHNAVSSAAVSGNPLVSFVLIALIYEHLRENTGVKTHLALTSTHTHTSDHFHGPGLCYRDIHKQ